MLNDTSMHDNETICRACLENADNMKSIFQTENILNKNIRLCTVLNYCTNLDIYEGDGLPGKICHSCVAEVLKAFTFKQQFIRANTILRDKLLIVVNDDDDDKNAVNCTFEHVIVKQESDDEHGKLPHEYDTAEPKTEANGSDSDGLPDALHDHFDDGLEHDDLSLDGKDSKERRKRIKNENNFDDDDDDNVVDKEYLENYFKDHESDDEFMKNKKIEIREKLKKLAGNNEKSILTDRALRSYLRELKKRPRTKKEEKTEKTVTYNCKVCSKQLSSSSSLKTHMSTHSKDKQHLCSTCGEGFRTKSAYDDHLMTHSTTDPFKCSKCSKIFKNKRSLRDHLRIHVDVKPYLCGVCGKGLTQKVALKKHLMIHTGEKPYECDLCGKKFRYMNVLKLHKRYHTGERPFPCTECGKRFKERTHLRKHMMIHTGEKPFECEYCGKRFNTKTYLTAHRKTHTGERNHFCAVCGKGFIQRNVMRNHMATHQQPMPPIEPYAVPIIIPGITDKKTTESIPEEESTQQQSTSQTTTIHVQQQKPISQHTVIPQQENIPPLQPIVQHTPSPPQQMQQQQQIIVQHVSSHEATSPQHTVLQSMHSPQMQTIHNTLIQTQQHQTMSSHSQIQLHNMPMSHQMQHH